MNIVFILKNLNVGGVEIVTQILSKKFVKEGHHVSIFSFMGGDPSIAERMDNRVKVYQFEEYSSSRVMIHSLRNILVNQRIDIIINQWGLPLIPIRVARKASKGLGINIISVYHNAPDANGRIRAIDLKLCATNERFKKGFYKIWRRTFELVTSLAMRCNYRMSDRFIVLSDSYIKVFQDFTSIRRTPKLRVLTNPVTIKCESFEYCETKKQKEIIFVGRLDVVQKRVNRVIDAWSTLENSHPDWRLSIVGDGPDRKTLEQQVKSLSLKRVSFEGFQNPLEYYKRSSVLVLTSDFEGFPLVIAEAMSFGVVPVVYDSFAAVNDIITNRIDGIIVQKKMGTFSTEEMSRGVEMAIQDCESNRTMAQNAIEKSKIFSIDTIYEKWCKLFYEISSC